MAPIDSAERPEVAFKEIHDVTEPTQVESLCVNCEQNVRPYFCGVLWDLTQPLL